MQTATAELSLSLEDHTGLLHIDGLVMRMFSLVADGVASATEALLAEDREIVRAVMATHLDVSALQREIEGLVEKRLLVRAALEPAELRALMAVLRIAPALERSAELIEHIAVRAPQLLTAELSGRARCLLHEMGETARALWCSTAEVYGDGDASSLGDLRELDDALDDLHVDLTLEVARQAASVTAAIQLGLVARFYERLGANAISVARWVAVPVDA